MDKIRLKILISDWIYIVLIAFFLGFFISFVFFFLNEQLQNISTIVFTTTSSVIISIFAFILITISNEYVLPRIKEKYWYLISFLFSFLSGFLGFLFSIYIFSISDFNIIKMVMPYSLYISITTGLLTFLFGLILHQFISMKYRNESIKTEFLETKIKALENELNPHFLFNALNSISELIYIDKKRAESAILDLSSFLRNAITKDSLITLSSEMQMVNTYVFIENIRFEDKIKLKFKSKDDANIVLVPKFSIQLLVENAIKHGFCGKELNIDIVYEQNNIKVINDGLIPNKDLLFGTGLTNLQKRLDLLQIGKLVYNKDKDKIEFIIELKG